MAEDQASLIQAVRDAGVPLLQDLAAEGKHISMADTFQRLDPYEESEAARLQLAASKRLAASQGQVLAYHAAPALTKLMIDDPEANTHSEPALFTGPLKSDPFWRDGSVLSEQEKQTVFGLERAKKLIKVQAERIWQARNRLETIEEMMCLQDYITVQLMLAGVTSEPERKKPKQGDIYP